MRTTLRKPQARQTNRSCAERMSQPLPKETTILTRQRDSPGYASVARFPRTEAPDLSIARKIHDRIYRGTGGSWSRSFHVTFKRWQAQPCHPRLVRLRGLGSCPSFHVLAHKGCRGCYLFSEFWQRGMNDSGGDRKKHTPGIHLQSLKLLFFGRQFEELKDVGDGIIAAHHHLGEPRPVTSLGLWNIEVMHQSKCTLNGHVVNGTSWPNVEATQGCKPLSPPSCVRPSWAETKRGSSPLFIE